MQANVDLGTSEVMSRKAQTNQEVRRREPFKSGDPGRSTNRLFDPIHHLRRTTPIQPEPDVVPDPDEEDSEKELESYMAPHRLGTSQRMRCNPVETGSP